MCAGIPIKRELGAETALLVVATVSLGAVGEVAGALDSLEDVGLEGAGAALRQTIRGAVRGVIVVGCGGARM